MPDRTIARGRRTAEAVSGSPTGSTTATGGPDHDVYADSLATGAIISGRCTFDLAGRWDGDHHDGIPILVLTHHVERPPEQVPATGT